MSVVVTGLDDTLKLMRKFAPDLAKRMNKEIKAVMLPIRDNARKYVPQDNDMLSGWVKPFASQRTANYRPFPRFDNLQMRQGIVYRQGASKTNSDGFRNLYYIANFSAPGSIFETAGRREKPRDPSRSLNPNARAQFLARIEEHSAMRGYKGKRGRLLYRAWAEDNGKAYPAVLNAIHWAVNEFATGKSQDQKSYGLVA